MWLCSSVWDRKKSFLRTDCRNESSKGRERGSIAAGLTCGVDLAMLASANAASEQATRLGSWRVVTPELLQLHALWHLI